VVERQRAVRRQTEHDAADQSAARVARFGLIELDAQIAQAAANVQPATLRSLAAIHLASALALVDELSEVVTYDAHLAEATRGSGLSVAAPA
jgi:predicted nucleic acid-binding protein